MTNDAVALERPVLVADGYIRFSGQWAAGGLGCQSISWMDIAPACDSSAGEYSASGYYASLQAPCRVCAAGSTAQATGCTETFTFTGADPGEGLDFAGEFEYAVSLSLSLSLSLSDGPVCVCVTARV